LWLFVLPTLAGCQFDPYTMPSWWTNGHSYATEKPQASEIVGSWTATEETLSELSRTAYSKAHPMISVKSDGSIQMRDIPDTWQTPFGAGKLEDFSGNWQFEKIQDSWWGLALRRGDWGCGGCLMVLGNKSPYRLVIRFGDPDQGLGYEFRKSG
jgi:hypothetical protein